MQKFIASRKRGREFPERIALDIAQRNIENNELRVVRRRRDRNVALTDHVRKISVVARVSAEAQAQACVLVRFHGRTPGTNVFKSYFAEF